MGSQFLKYMNINFDFTCTRAWIDGDVPLQIWEAISADGHDIPIFIVRLFHNKPVIYGTNFLRCYSSYLSPDFITRTFTIIGLVLYLIGLYGLVAKNKKLFLAALILAPLFPLMLPFENRTISGVIIYGALLFVIAYGIYFLSKSLKKILGK